MNRYHFLVVSTLYPNKIQIRHGIFVESRIKHLRQTGKVELKVIAPVPWFPVKSRWFAAYSKFVDVPEFEIREGIEVYHPRYIVIPKIGMLITPLFLAFSVFRQIRKIEKQGFGFDFIDAHYFYPDGVAAAIVAKLLNKALLITARGTDINVIANLNLPGKMIIWASKIARFNLAVSEPLRQKMLAIGIEPDSTVVSRNGVDLTLFKPLIRDEVRAKWQVTGKLLISVGNLIELKGHHIILEALASLPDFNLFIVGKGDWQTQLLKLADDLQVHDRVRFVGEILQNELAELYTCADALVLASSREGWPNVLLEAMACGTPVIATDAGASREIVQAAEAGVICENRSSESVVAAVGQLFADYPDRSKTRQYAEKFSWDETTQGLLQIFSQLRL
jgi:glycosyltransferase involved in cell wall biosynthesis